MKRIKKADPELLLVSFCDILTISISGLFMATIITVFEATKIPELSMTPRAIPTKKAALFFECRNDSVYFVDNDRIAKDVERLLSTVSQNVRSGDPEQFLRAIREQQIGNEYYTVDPAYLLTAIVALNPRPGVTGFRVEDIDTERGRFKALLDRLDKENYYIAFLVRDDSFDVFRKARIVADKIGFDTGWELLDADEPIKFGTGGIAINVTG
jgi:hypothetical protein